MDLYSYNKKLGNIEGFPSNFITPLSDLGINTVKDLETAEVSTIARCVHDQKETAGDQANEPIIIGAEMAAHLQFKYRCSAPAKANLDSRPDRFVYKAPSARRIVLRKTMTALVNDGAGGYNKEIAGAPISVSFEGGRNSYGILIVTPMLAKSHGLDIDQLRTLLEGHSQFGSEFFLVSKPDEDATIQAAKGEPTKIKSGARATSDV